VLVIETRLLALRSSVLKFAYRVLRSSAESDGESPQLLAEGETTHVIVDREMQKKSLPEKYLAVLRTRFERVIA
jgi:acyl-CoA thioester hydrolase